MVARKKSPRKKSKPKSSPKPPTPIHPWRLCPAGQHWVSEHERHLPPTPSLPARVTSVRGHCAWNPTHKDQIYRDELAEIAAHEFSDLSGPPKADAMGFKGIGNRFDELIRGWTRYWNEVLKPETPLDPNLVKALIATESGFDVRVKPQNAGKTQGKARGLIQVTDSTLKILSNEKGEIKDHYVNLTREDMADPNLNIAAGVRWLFRKKEIADSRYKKTSTWRDAVLLYKDYTRKEAEKMADFDDYYARLKRR